MASFLTALALLTRIPVRNAACTPEAIGRSAAFFPVVGAVIGGLQVAVLWAARRAMPPTLTAVLVVLAGILLTGAMHLDGLADTVDGLGAGGARDEMLRIMRDSRIGTYGAVALIAVLMAQVAAVAALIERDAAGPVLVSASIASRWTLVWLGRWIPYARPDEGMGRVMTDHVRGREVIGSTLIAMVSVPILTGARGLVSLGAAAALTGLLGLTARKRIGGITGDTLGANAVLSETAALVAAVTLVSIEPRAV